MPQKTSRGVCPKSSLSTAYGFTSWFFCTNSSTRRFKVAAVFPAALLNPAASCIITSEKPIDTAKSIESIPSTKATDVDSAITPAVCDEGIPPVVVNI